MAYRVIASSSVKDDLKTIPQPFRKNIQDAIITLADNPRPSGVKKLSGMREAYRIRIGQYRVGYKIQDRQLIVLVIAVAERGKIYPLLKRRLK